ncbi:MAG: hypothetical protein V1841_01840 [Patescibacteria group bacterium]
MVNRVVDLKTRESKEGEDTLLDWEIEEGVKREKKMQIGIIVFLIAFLLFTIWQKSYLGMILALVIAFLFFSPKSKKKIYFAILKRGARRENELFTWQNLKSFWIFEDTAEIYFTNKKKFLPYHVVFPLPREYVQKARGMISAFLEEKEVERDFLDIISKKIGL